MTSRRVWAFAGSADGSRTRRLEDCMSFVVVIQTTSNHPGTFCRAIDFTNEVKRNGRTREIDQKTGGQNDPIKRTPKATAMQNHITPSYPTKSSR
jgi:hypothetical protein